MKYSLNPFLISVLFALVSACFPSVQPYKPVDWMHEYYDVNQDQFTFIVLDKKSCDSFNRKYAPLTFQNASIINAFRDTLLNLPFLPEADSTIPKSLFNYSNNTTMPDTNSFSLAHEVINAVVQHNKNDYFQPSLQYLFFYECLPTEIKYKWHQTVLGGFEFNTTFFNRLRLCDTTFDKLCYGESWNVDPQLSPGFAGFTYNEISVMNAKSMKTVIETDTAFGDPRMSYDKEVFLPILDSVANNKWRLIILNWD